jgi:hypothetical protein
MSGELKRMSTVMVKKHLIDLSTSDFVYLNDLQFSFFDSPTFCNWMSVYNKHSSLFEKMNREVDQVIQEICQSPGFNQNMEVRKVVIIFERERLKLGPFRPLYSTCSQDLLEKLLQTNNDRLTQMIVWVQFLRLILKKLSQNK